MAILIIIILAAVVFNFTIKQDDTKEQKAFQENTNPSQQTSQIITQNPPQTPPRVQSSPPQTPQVQPTPPPAPAPEPILPSVTASQLQSILQKSPEMNKLPSNTQLIIQFHNDINQFTGHIFFIGSKGSVSEYSNQNYDMRLTININTIPQLEASTTICSDIKNIIQSGKAWVIDQSSNPFVLLKYLSLKSCVK